MKGVRYNSVKLIRCVFNYESEFGAAYLRTEVKITNYGEKQKNGEPTRTFKSRWSSVAYNKEEDLAKSYDNLNGSRTTKFLVYMQRRPAVMQAPLDLRACWSQGRFDHGAFESERRNMPGVVSAAKETATMQKRGETAKLLLPLTFQIGNAYKGEWEIMFDSRTMMPKSHTHRIYFDPLKSSVFSTMEIDWLEKEGIQVPVELNWKRSEQIPELPQVHAAISSKVTAHWFSLNNESEIDNSLIDGSQVDGKEAIRKLTDPQLTGADSLIEADE